MNFKIYIYSIYVNNNRTRLKLILIFNYDNVRICNETLEGSFVILIGINTK